MCLKFCLGMTAIAERISVRDRMAACDHLESVARYLNGLAAWLGEHGAEVEADMTNDSAKALLGVCWWLSRPLRPGPPPESWPHPAENQAPGGWQQR